MEPSCDLLGGSPFAVDQLVELRRPRHMDPELLFAHAAEPLGEGPLEDDVQLLKARQDDSNVPLQKAAWLKKREEQEAEHPGREAEPVPGRKVEPAHVNLTGAR